MTVPRPVLSDVRSKVVNPVFLQEALRNISVTLFALLGAQQALQQNANGRETDRGAQPSDGLSKHSAKKTCGEMIAPGVRRGAAAQSPSDSRKPSSEAPAVAKALFGISGSLE